MDIYFINVFYAHGIACAFARSGERGSRSKQTCVSTRCRKPFGISIRVVCAWPCGLRGSSQLRPALQGRRCAAAEGAPLSLHPIWPTPPPARTRACNGARPRRPRPVRRPNAPEYAPYCPQVSALCASSSTRCCSWVSADRIRTRAVPAPAASARPRRPQPPAARMRPNTPTHCPHAFAPRAALGAAAGW